MTTLLPPQPNGPGILARPAARRGTWRRPGRLALHLLASLFLVLTSLPLSVLVPPSSFSFLAGPQVAEAAAGDLDPTFDTDGKVTTPMSAGDDYAYAVVVQPSDGKIVVAGKAAVNGGDFALARYCPDGRLDDGVNCGGAGFGTGGKVTTAVSPGTGYDAIYDLALLSNGKLLAVGTATSGDATLSSALARYLPNGSLDPDFGTEGKVTTQIGARSEAYSVAVQTDGKLVVAGPSSNGTNDDFAVARYCPNGTLDDGLNCGPDGFGTGGKVTTAFASGYTDVAYDVAVQTDGRIVAVGRSGDSPGATSIQDYAVARYQANGALDTSFGGTGKVLTNVNPSGVTADVATTVALQPDGRILVGGHSWVNQWDFSLVRYLDNGTLDPGFGSGGKVTTSVGSYYDAMGEMALQPDGKIVVAGSMGTGPGDFANFDAAVVRYLANGTLDTSFGTGGKRVVALSTGDDKLGPIALQPDGRIVVAGHAHNGTDYDFALARLFGTPPARLAVTSVNGGVSPTEGQPFTVTVQSQDAAGAPVPVTQNTTVTLSKTGGNGSGLLQGNVSGIIQTGQSSVTIEGVTFSQPETGVVVTATASGGDTMTAGVSTAFDVVSPSTLQFSLATTSVAENAGTATVSVTRTGGSAGAVSVSYATTDLTAFAGSDYTAASGTLSWASGEMSARNFEVTITDDAVYEGTEAVRLTLSSPTGGATLGAQSTAKLTITNNDPTLAANSIVTPWSGPTQDTSLALDAAGNPVVSFYDNRNGQLKVLHCGDPACTAGNSIATPQSLGGSGSSLVLDADGNPVVSYHATSTPPGSADVMVLHCGNSTCTAGNTVARLDTQYAGNYTSLALDAAGNPVVSYGYYVLKVAHCGDPTCTAGNSITSPDSAECCGFFSSLALDTAGNPVVAYRIHGFYDSMDKGVKVLHCGNPTCTSGNTITPIVSYPYAGGSYNSLELDALGKPVISYYGFEELRVVHCGDTTCSTGNSNVALDSAGIVGWYTSLELDTAGRPVVSYADATTGSYAIKVLRCGDATCSAGNTIFSLSTPINPPRGVALALDAADNPVVSYHSDTAGGLQVLHCVTPTCIVPSKVAITAISPTTPGPAPATFSVTVESRDASNAAAGVIQDTVVTLSKKTGSGNGLLQGTLSGTILAGQSSATIEGVTLSKVESGVVLTATASSGDTLSAADSASLNVAPSGLVSWWAGEGNAADSQGSNHGTLQGGVAFATGKAGQAFSFDGVDDFVELGTPASLMPANADFTISGWVKVPDSPNNGYQVGCTANYPIIGFDWGWSLGVVAGGLVSFGIYKDFSTGLGINSTMPIPTNEFHHIAAVHTLDELRVFIDGVLAGTQPTTDGTVYYQPGDTLQVGRRDCGSGHWNDKGQIDELGFFNRALTTAEIRYLAGTNPTKLAFTNVNSATSPTVGLSFSVTVESRDASNVAAPVSQDTTVTLTKTSSSGSGLLQGTLTGTILAGQSAVTITGVTFSQPEAGVVLTATATSGDALTPGDSAAVNVVAPVCVAPLGGLASWWPGEGSAADIWDGNPGTLMSGATFAPGMVGQAFHLDGVNDYVRMGDVLDAGTGSFSIDLWYRATRSSSGILMKLLNKGMTVSGTPPGAGYHLRLENGMLNFQVVDAGASAVPAQVAEPALNTFHHVAGVLDRATSTVKLYVDGQLASQNSFTTLGSLDTNVPFAIGALERPAPDVTSEFFQGDVDEVAFFNRTLSAAEIQAIYNAGSAGQCRPAPTKLTITTFSPASPNPAPSIFSITVESRNAGDVVTPVTQDTTVSLAKKTGSGALGGTVTGTIPAGQSSATIAGVTFSRVANGVVLTAAATAGDALAAGDSAAFNVLLPGLVSWWRAEGNANDSYGSHHGSLQGGATYAAGKAGQAFSLDGTDDYIGTGGWSPGSRWTVLAWARPASAPGGRHTIAGGVSGCADWGIVLQDGQFGTPFRQPGGCTQTVSSGASATLSTWSHVAGTSDGTTARIYVNGMLKGSSAVEPNYVGTTDGTRIGGEVCCPGNNFLGLVDEVQVYNRALSEAEIRSVMAGSSPAAQLAVTAVSPASPNLAPATFSVTVESRDASGLVMPVAVDTTVTLSRKTGTGTLGGTLAGTIPAGQTSVTISGVTYGVAETGVVLTATATAGDTLAAGDSAPFAVAAPITLVFTGQPAKAAHTFAFGIPPVVEVQQAGGTLGTDTRVVTLRIKPGTGAAGATLTCAGGLDQAAGAGVATFADCRIDLKGTGYVLEATATGALAAETQAFDVTWAGDANGDCLVDIVDFSVLVRSFGKQLGDAGFDARADLNGDNRVDILDFSLLVSGFGTRCPV